MIAGTTEGKYPEEPTTDGLYHGHQYTILDVLNVYDRNHRSVTLLKIRNPHG